MSQIRLMLEEREHCLLAAQACFSQASKGVPCRRPKIPCAPASKEIAIASCIANPFGDCP